MDRYRLEAELLEGNSSEKNLAVLVDNRLTMSSSVSLWPRRPLGALKKKSMVKGEYLPPLLCNGEVTSGLLRPVLCSTVQGR